MHAKKTQGKKLLIVGLILGLLLMITAASVSAHEGPMSGDSGVLVAEGFNAPQGILVDEEGAVWVIDSGLGGDDELPWISTEGQPITATSGDSATISRIDSEGNVEVVANLPSVFTGDEAIGGARLAMLDGVLYATSGQGIGSPDVEAPANMGAVVAIVDGEVVQVASTWDFERENNPDPALFDSHPYGITTGPDGMLYVTDAGANALLRIDPATGEVELVAVFEAIPGVFPRPERGGEMLTDPVPTAVVFDGDGNAYVSYLSGAPFIPGSAKVVMVSPDGEVSDYATGLTMLTDLRWGPDGSLYGVQFGMFTEEGPVPNSGAVLHIKGGEDFDVAVEGLAFPTSLDFNAGGDAYVTVNGVGAPGSGAVMMFAGLAPAMMDDMDMGPDCSGLPSHEDLTAALKAVVSEGGNSGFGFNMWASTVNRDGEVCAITFSGEHRGDQFPGSRAISAAKANTANSFSLPGFALSSANLFSATQPGASLFGLADGNPLNVQAVYAGHGEEFGTAHDPLVGQRVGGTISFAGGLALYDADGVLVGALGLSGDSACTDHIIAWKVRDALGLDNVPAGVSPTGDDNIVYGGGAGWDHPECDADATEIGNALPTDYPIGE